MGQECSHTRLRINNNTTSDVITTRIFPVDNYDWHDGCRPDHNMQNRQIPVNSSIEESENTNAKASGCGFSMEVQLSDGRKFRFSIHQKHAIGCCPNFGFDGNVGVKVDYRRFDGNGLEITFTDSSIWKKQKEDQNILIQEEKKRRDEEIKRREEKNKEDERQREKEKEKQRKEETKQKKEKLQKEDQELIQRLEQLKNEETQLKNEQLANESRKRDDEETKRREEKKKEDEKCREKENEKQQKEQNKLAIMVLRKEEQELIQRLKHLKTEEDSIKSEKEKKSNIVDQVKECCYLDDHAKAAKILKNSNDVFDKDEAKIILEKCAECKAVYLSLFEEKTDHKSASIS